MNQPKRTSKAEIEAEAATRYEEWMRFANERQPYMVCALCQGGGIVTVIGGDAVCVLCREVVSNFYDVREHIEAARRRMRQLGLPFGPTEWLESFKAEVKRDIKHEKRQQKLNETQARDDEALA